MYKWEKVNKNSKSKKNKLFNNKNFKPIQFKKIENSFKLDLNTNKTSIILFKKSQYKNISSSKNKKLYNNIKIYKDSKSKDKKSKTLNNTFHRKKNLLINKKTKNKSNFSKKEKRSKILLSEIKNKNKNDIGQKSKDKKILSPMNKFQNKKEKIKFFNQKRNNKTPIKDNNIHLFNKKLSISPSEKNKNIDYNYKTFYNDKSYYKSKINSIIERNKKDLISKEKSFNLKRNKSFNNPNPNYNIKSFLKNGKTKNNSKRNHAIENKLDEILNKTYTNKKEINSYSYYKKNERVNKNKNNTNKLDKKPRVDTLEYLTKIINSKKPKNLTEKQNEISSLNNKNNNKNEEYINIFRKNNNEKDKSNNEKGDIKKYIQVKKKLFKLNNIKKKKKEKEEELKKYLQLYKLQKNIFNSNNNTFYNNNNKIHNTSNSDKDYEEDEDDFLYNNHNNNEYLSSIDSTIVDKNNFYQGIIDIQKIYSNNIINNNIIINNFSNPESNSKKGKNTNTKKKDEINNKYHKNNKKLNEQYQKEPDNNNINSNTNLKKIELKEEKIVEINYVYSSLTKEEKENIQENEKETLKKEEDNNMNKLNDFQINELNEYSFKLNNSNSDSNDIKENSEINSCTTSKFCNSQLLSEQNRQSIKNINEEKKESTLAKENDLEKKEKYEFTKEKLDNYNEILTSLFEYLKLITQRNALNDIISYGDMKYKYKIGFEIILTLIKLAPFNIIRAIQQAQYYHFAFRQLFIPYITKYFHKLKSYCSYDKLFEKVEKKLKHIYIKIVIKKIKQFKKSDKNIEEIKELLSDNDISGSKENDLIEWDNSFFDGNQDIN